LAIDWDTRGAALLADGVDPLDERGKVVCTALGQAIGADGEVALVTRITGYR
jgi:hypothetical protein